MSPKVGSVKQRILRQLSMTPGLSTVNLTMAVISKSIPYASEMHRPIRAQGSTANRGKDRR